MRRRMAGSVAQGAHSKPRILFHRNVPEKRLRANCLLRLEANVEILEYTTMTDIMERSCKCHGIYALRQDGIG